MTRLRDVAEHAGVSISVASRVLTGDKSLRARQDTRERILQAARELGYVQNYVGRALRSSRTGAIALLVPDVNNAIFSEVFRGVEAGAAAEDLLVLLGRSQWLARPGRLEVPAHTANATDLDSPPNFAALLRQQGRIDGFIVQVGDDVPSSATKELLPKGTPAVLINWHLKGRFGSLAVDDRTAGEMATDFLVALGHRDIGLIGGLARTSTARQREEGYRASLAKAGARLWPGWTTRLGYTPQSGREALGHLLAARRVPTAVVVSNANAAVGVLSAAREAKLDVPGDLSVVAIHETWMAEHTSPPLTTVRLPTYDLGLQAIRALIRTIDGGPKEYLLITDPPPEIKPRASHGPGPFA
jgi:LacI family transcriptional regulator